MEIRGTELQVCWSFLNDDTVKVEKGLEGNFELCITLFFKNAGRVHTRSSLDKSFSKLSGAVYFVPSTGGTCSSSSSYRTDKQAQIVTKKSLTVDIPSQ